MAKLLTSLQMQAADQRTIKELGLPGIVLMENAGAGVVQVVRRYFPKARQVSIIAGRGNNGGDGFVVARRLLQAGITVQVFLLGREKDLSGDAAVNHHVYRNLGGRLQEIEDASQLYPFLSQCDVIVDALFGTGLSKPLTGLAAQVVASVNASGRPVVAVDLPSGVCADTGHILGVAMQARHTVTFGAEKIGHRTWPGAGCCGHLTLVDIGIPPSYFETPAHQVARNLPDDLIIPSRPLDGHKGSFGHLLIVAGSRGKAGAAVLAAKGAQCTGPGLVTVASPAGVQAQVASQLTEAMTWPLPEEDGCAAGHCANLLACSGLQPSALAIGPGLGQRADLVDLVRDLVRHFDLPAVLDADGLNAFSRQKLSLESLSQHRVAPLVITPHPGEMARLLETTVAQVQKNRLETAVSCARSWNMWVVLKGAGTVIADPQGRAWINSTGNPGLASGGSGDLLTGLIAGLLTLGWPVESAVRAGVWLHGTAADRFARREGAVGLLATKLVPVLRKLLNRNPFI